MNERIRKSLSAEPLAPSGRRRYALHRGALGATPSTRSGQADREEPLGAVGRT